MICFVCSLSSGNRSGVSFAVVVTVLAMVAQVVASLCRRIFVVLALTIVAVHPKYAMPYQVPAFLLNARVHLLLLLPAAAAAAANVYRI